MMTGGRGEVATAPRRVVAIGGGTGMPAVLRGLRELVRSARIDDLTAIVAMTDDGGSSGRLRRDRGMPPPGDVRNCLVALSHDEQLLSDLFQHRYDGDDELRGHAAGNLILAALSERCGSFLEAVELAGRVLRIDGRILPVTVDDVRLEATLDDGRHVVGESAIGDCRGHVVRLEMIPGDAPATNGVVEAIAAADLVVLGPGSLYTSIVPPLLVRDVAAALRRTSAVRVLVSNLVVDLGEAAGLTIDDHVRVVERVAGGRTIDAVLVNDGAADEPTLRRYRAEGATPLAPNAPDLSGRHVERRDLLAPGPKLRHDPRATVAGAVAAWSALRAVGPRHEAAGIRRGRVEPEGGR